MTISIVTATFNSAATIKDAMQSVLNQTFGNWEHIIVDGASTDGTMAIVKEYEPLYNGRLKYISKPDKGIYEAFNTGIEIASGQIVGILNSDDFFTSDDVLSHLHDALENHPELDAVYGDVHYINAKNPNKCIRYYSSAGFRRWKMFFGFQPAHPSFYCHKHIYMRFGTFDTNFPVAADFENLLRLIYIHRIKTLYIPVDCVTMRVGGASTSGLKSHVHILRDHLKAYSKNGVRSNIVFDCSRYIFKICSIIIQRLFPVNNPTTTYAEH